MRLPITVYLELDLDREMWCCASCHGDLIAAGENYKRGCRVQARDPAEVHQRMVVGGEYSLAPDANWCRIVEFYCPHCATMVENEYLPIGHPITHDIEIDIERLKLRRDI